MNNYDDLINILTEISNSLKEISVKSFFESYEPLISIALSIITLGSIVYIGIRQCVLTKKMSSIQNKIAADSITLSVYEKQYRIYSDYIKLYASMNEINFREYDKLRTLIDNFYPLLSEIKYLFDEDLYKDLDNDLMKIRSVVDAMTSIDFKKNDNDSFLNYKYLSYFTQGKKYSNEDAVNLFKNGTINRKDREMFESANKLFRDRLRFYENLFGKYIKVSDLFDKYKK